MKKSSLLILLFLSVAVTAFAGYYTCKRCNGSGYDNMTRTCTQCSWKKVVSELTDCPTCQGKGYTRNGYGDQVTCSKCDGAKKIIKEHTCPRCNGTGTEKMVCPKCKGTGTVYVSE